MAEPCKAKKALKPPPYKRRETPENAPAMPYRRVVGGVEIFEADWSRSETNQAVQGRTMKGAQILSHARSKRSICGVAPARQPSPRKAPAMTSRSILEATRRRKAAKAMAHQGEPVTDTPVEIVTALSLVSGTTYSIQNTGGSLFRLFKGPKGEAPALNVVCGVLWPGQSCDLTVDDEGMWIWCPSGQSVVSVVNGLTFRN